MYLIIFINVLYSFKNPVTATRSPNNKFKAWGTGWGGDFFVAHAFTDDRRSIIYNILQLRGSTRNIIPNLTLNLRVMNR